MKILNEISQEYLLKLLGLDNLPKKYLDKYEEFIEYLKEASEDFMTHEELAYDADILKIEDDVKLELHKCLDLINDTYEAKLACYYYKYISYIAYYSTANQIYAKVSSYALEDYILHTFIIIAPFKWRYEEALARSIPRKYLEPQFRDLSHHIHRWMRTRKTGGVIRWDTIVAYLELFPIDTLTLEPFDNTVAWHGFINDKGEKIILMQENKNIRKDGQIDGVNGVYDYYFTTTFCEDDKYYYGNPVDPYGVVLKDVIRLPKDTWQEYPKKDDWFIEFHVSSHNPYTIEAFQSSIRKGIRFFKKYYPERNFVAVRGFSWLFSPQLKYIIDENKGNISRIKKCGYTVPTATGEGNVFNFVFHNVNIKPEEIPETTSLYRGIKKFLLAGGRINCGEMMFFLDDLDQMMDNVYQETFPTILDKLKNDAF